jgi:hypothetical protein
VITFEEARERATEAVLAEWDGPGTFYCAPDGYEDAQAFLVTIGAEEWLVDGDADFAVLGDPLILVDKVTGAVSFWPELERDRIDAMTAVFADKETE